MPVLGDLENLLVLMRKHKVDFYKGRGFEIKLNERAFQETQPPVEPVDPATKLEQDKARYEEDLFHSTI